MLGSRKINGRLSFQNQRAIIKGAKLHSRNQNIRKTYWSFNSLIGISPQSYERNIRRER